MRDLLVHELAHLAGGLAVSAVAVEALDGEYYLADRVMAGFTHIDDDILGPSINEDSGYYAGPVLEESWPALQSRRLLRAQDIYANSQEREIGQTYYIHAEIQGGPEPIIYPVVGLHSDVAGVILEAIDAKYPGVISTMAEVVDGSTSLGSVRARLRDMLPPSTISLLNTPRYTAWQELLRLYGAG